MTALYLVRHAQPVYQGYQETPELAPLSEKGRAGQRAAGGLSAGEGDRANLFQPLPAGGADAGAAGPAAGFAH